MTSRRRISICSRLAGAAIAVAAATAPQAAISQGQSAATSKGAVLVYTKAAGFKHASIPAGAEAIRKLGEANNFSVEVTDDAAAFTPTNLAKYKAVIFLNTTGNVLPDPAQRSALEGYIRGGGGYFGVHAAADMGVLRDQWPFYHDLVGGSFKGHTAARLWSDNPIPPSPMVTYVGKLAEAPAHADTVAPGMKATSEEPATIVVEDKSSPLVRGWGATETRIDEWYGYRTNPRSRVHVVATLDEKSYSPAAGLMNGDHPIIWCHAYQGGRSVYTGLGHSVAAWSDAKFLPHILGGIELAMGTVPFRCGT